MLDSEDEVPPEVIEFNKFKALGKDLLRKHKYRDGLKALEAAYGIHQSEKLSRKIKKIRDFLEEEQESSEEEEEDDGMEEISKGFKLSKHLYNQLYQYQREGISWLWGLHQKNKGGILGDDMGLGKTVQAIAFLSGLFAMRTIQTALLVMPVSLIKNWEEEIEKWAPELKVAIYHGTSQREKDSNLTKTQRRGGILLTSYGTLLSSIEKLSRSTKSGSLFKWDYFILDEGHKIKNPTGTTKAAHEIKANHRVVLTGTPIQNNLKELWALYDFCHQGSLLGTLSTFRIQYENPINKSREKDASAGQKRFGTRIAENLRNLIGPYFLRRTKQETIDKENYNPDGTKRECAQLTKKNEFILWLYLSPKQIELYNDFLMSDEVKSILSTSRSPLVHLNVLKKVCDHPRLFTKRICAQVGLDGSNNDDSLNDSTADQVSLNVSPTLLLQESGKMEALITLLNHLRETGHRTLVFSMSRKILDIIQKILSQSNWKIMRLDGTVTKMDERQARIKKFQTNSTYSVFLLTTQVGGVGLTLTAADRVVIYDPSWNPATDAQAVDRAYRIGQTRNVVVYRFITCGTIEEKIYRRQIFKDSITRQATCKGKQDNDPHRYFTKSELRELFVLDDPRCSKTQEQLQEMHAAHRKTTPELIKHIAFLERNMEKHVFGISDHDLMFRGNMPLEDVTEVQYQSSEKQEAEFIERQEHTSFCCF